MRIMFKALLKRIGYALLLLLSVTSCSSNNPSANNTPNLIGAEWNWVAYSASSSSEFEEVNIDAGTNTSTSRPGYFIQFFEGSGYGGADGCNGFGGHWASWDKTIYFIDGVQTGRSCRVDPNETIAKFNLPVGVEIGYSIEDAKLTLFMPSGEIFVFANSK